MGDFPQAQPTDNDDLSLALDVARARFGAGDHEEAIKWLRKAADAAFDAGDDRRGMELSKAAAELKPAPAAAPAPPAPKVAPAVAAKPGSQPGRSAAPPSGLPKPLQKPVVPSAAHMNVKPSVSRSQPPAKPSQPKTTPPPKPQIDRPKPEEDESTREFQVQDRPPSKLVEAPPEAAIDEIMSPAARGDEWPTESVSHVTEAGDFTDRMRRDEILKAASEELPVCPSLRVAVWRTAEGTVMVRPLDSAGLNDGEQDMVLVALTPETDLRDLFR